MKTITAIQSDLFDSGEFVEPGLYVDIETGATVQVCEKDELPTGRRVVTYRRRFRRLDDDRHVPALAA